jgi:hypothetical protein
MRAPCALPVCSITMSILAQTVVWGILTVSDAVAEPIGGARDVVRR